MDEACVFLAIPEFEREAGVPVTVTFHATALSDRSIILIPESCTGDACAAREVVVHGSEYDTDTSMMSVTFLGSVGGLRYVICSSPDDGRCSQRLAIVYLHAGCRFAGTDETPCDADVCAPSYFKTDGGDACMQVMSAYCAEHPEDTGCAFLIPKFERIVGEATQLAFHFADIDGVPSAYFVPETCACGAYCPPTEVDVIALSYSEMGVLFVDVRALTEGLFTLCLEDSGPARSVAYFAASKGACLFTEMGPCSEDACADPTSEACAAVTLAYCAEHPEAPCDFFIFQFTRTAFVAADLELLVPPRALAVAHASTSPTAATGPVAEPFFVANGCGCDRKCHGAVDVTAHTLDVDTRLLQVTFVGGAVATARLCLTEGEDGLLAEVVFTATCTFDSGVDSPCALDECIEDPLGEACQLVMAEYCRMNTEDGACALLLPTFVREAKVTSELSFHADLPPYLDFYILPPTCACGAADMLTCAERAVAIAYDRLTGLFTLQIEPELALTYSVCHSAETGFPAAVVATLETYPGLATFDTEIRPCATNDIPIDSDECMQAFAE
jgi:hypothetical protein